MLANLWQRDSANDELYADLFGSQNNEFFRLEYMRARIDNQNNPPAKDINGALRKREAGNREYGRANYKKAIQWYNLSLCLAPRNTELIGLAYGNRSICYYKLKMYGECIVDIELARRENYPLSKYNKLNQREYKCLEFMGMGNARETTSDIGLKLSYPPDETFTSVANVLHVEVDETGRLKATAKEDIGAGKTIVVERAFATYTVMGHISKCNVCLKTNINLVPCEKCTIAMFCHDDCVNNTFHEGECGLVFGGIANQDAQVLKEVRIILIVIDMFEDADELMDFVRKVVTHEPMDVLVSGKKSRYRDFLNLPLSQPDPNMQQQFMGHLYCMNKLALEVRKVRQFFGTIKYRRFLMHLLALHYQITEDNSNWVKHFFGRNDQVRYHIYVHGILGVRRNFFDVSCAPNVMNCDHNDLSIFITIRPIKEGEELSTCIYDYLLVESRSKRQEAHWALKNSRCKCPRCEGLISATSEQEREIKSHPDYQILSSRRPMNAIPTDDKEATNTKYVNFLNKYGHIPWCDAIGKVVLAYVNFLRDIMWREGFTIDVSKASMKLNNA